MIPGEIRIKATGKDISLHPDRAEITLLVANRGDRPVQVGSHYHFFEVNKALHFDRPRAYGMRLLIPSGTTVRFEPGEEKPVRLTAFGGGRCAYGFAGLVSGPTAKPPSDDALNALIDAWRQGGKAP